ncbi:unnamed protein product [Rhizophagus irregularis]|nr:unnamed protein product [Rhizophagus irregularis]
MEEESSEDIQTSEFTHDDCNNIVVPNPEDEIIDKENVDPLTPILRNPKKRSGKGRPLGTKRFKSSTDAPKPKSRNQRNCRKCGKVGQNCKEQEI